VIYTRKVIAGVERKVILERYIEQAKDGKDKLNF
jgi:hypothetical protein